MRESNPQEDLEIALNGFWNDSNPDEILEEETGQEQYARVPLWVLHDAIERLERYETIVNNLTDVSEFLWKEI